MNKLDKLYKWILFTHVVLIVVEVGFIIVKMALWSWLIPVVFCLGAVIWLIFGKRRVSLVSSRIKE